MSDTEQARTDPADYTGDRALYAQREGQYRGALAGAQNPDVVAIAAAIRAGLSEIAVEISSIRGFGVGQANK